MKDPVVPTLIDDLGRTFIEVDRDDAPDIETAAMVARMTGKSIGWADVLAHPRSVLLGEAGTGKTTEFELQRERCRLDGTPAFFCRIEDLADDGLERALESASDWEEFQGWRAGEGQAVFLLDSVDEARLRGKNVARALSALNHELKAARDRATVLISCRASDWQAHADRAMVAKRLPGPLLSGKTKGRDKDAPAVRVFAFAPLNEVQVRRLAVEAYGLNNVDAFLREVHDAQADVFLHRPRDVEWMILHQQQTGRIGLLSEVIAANISKKLAEPRHSVRPCHAELAVDRLAAGACSLAAAVIFTRKPAYRLPDDGPRTDLAPDALDTAEVLTGWTDAERQELLSRALFDEATYGRVRFHHRSVIEHLTAQWLADRIGPSGTSTEVEGILFPEVYGRRFAAPTLAPVIGWLAGSNERIRRLAETFAPSILIEHGDPRVLPVDTRAGILRAVVSRLHATSHARESVSYEALDRFAAPELGSAVRELYAQFGADDRVAALLLRMARHGRMTECADLALTAVLDRTDEMRSWALWALQRIGSQSHKATVAERLAADPSQWSDRDLGQALELCLPEGMFLAQFLDVIERTAVHHAQFRDGLHTALATLAEQALPEPWLPEVLARFLDLMQREPGIMEDGKPVASKMHAGLRGALARVLVRLLNGNPSQLPEGAVLEAVDFLEHTHWRLPDHHFQPKNIIEAIGHHPVLKRSLFWRGAERYRQQHGRAATHVVQVHSDGESYWVLAADDWPWLVDDLAARPDPDDRTLALHGSLVIWHQSGRPEDLLKRMRLAVGDDVSLLDEIERVINPAPSVAAEEQQRKAEQYKRERERVLAEHLAAARARFAEELDGIRGGEAVSALHALWNEMDGDNSRQTKTDTASLVPAYGEDIAAAAREGFKRGWRRWASETPRSSALVLSGIGIDIEDGLALHSLSPTEALAAARCALLEMNDYPEWFLDLLRAHPAAVREAFAASIDNDWISVSEHGFTEVLGRLSHTTASIRDLVMSHVLDRLESREPASLEATRAAVRLLERSEPVQRDRLATLAARRVSETVDDHARLMIWLPLWMSLDGPAALSFLEDRLSAMPSTAEADALVMDLCSMLYGHSYFALQAIGGIPDDVPSLTRLVTILFRHVRRADDNAHPSGGYKPNRRDHAEEVRWAALRRLSSIPSKATYQALLDLADQLASVAEPDIFRRLADERAAGDADPAPWTPNAVTAFERDHEALLVTAADLFRIAVRRLHAIKADLEGGDFSQRLILGPGTDEETVQLWLADQLRLRANGRYTVHREEHVDQAKRTDIRLHNAAVEGPVCIEIKVVSRWTTRELEAAPEKQLVGQYLRDQRSRYGIFLLFHTGELPKQGGPLNFPDLLHRLDAKAQQLVTHHPSVDRLDVVGMDATLG